jgi:hypothetical protein
MPFNHHLGQQMGSPFNWAGNKQWEKTYKNCIIHKTVNGLGFLIINIENIGHAMKSIKRNTYWQGYSQQVRMNLETQVVKEILSGKRKEIIVFEETKDNEIIGYAEP